jgi:SecD/SecF fusion protein
MKKNITLGILLAVAVVAVCTYLLIPSIIFYSKSPEAREAYVSEHPDILKKIINLGLDLQGGMRLVLELDASKVGVADKDLLDRAYTIIENRINALGVAEPTIQKQGKDRIIVELPGLKDEKAAKNVIGRTAQLEFNLLRDPAQLEHAINIIDKTVSGNIEKDSVASDSTVSDSSKVKTKEQQNLADKLFKGAETQDTNKSAVSDSAAANAPDEVTSFKDLLVSIGDQLAVRMEDVGKVNTILSRQDVKQSLERSGLGGNAFLWSHDTSHSEGSVFRTLYYVRSSPEMRGDAIKDAQASIDQTGMRAGGAKVDLEMNSRGARKFSSVTGANVNKFLAIVLDSTVYSAPRIIQKIPLGRAEITGNFSMEEARDLAIVLRAGALPAPVHIIEERTVGPSLGQDSIDKALLAALVGVIFVIAFALFYYRLSGAIALIALAINIMSVLGIMALLNATLTLPGIAGLILQVAMGIDANVIIFERIREELRLGKTVRGGIDSGYKMAFWTIMDSHLTALITGFILLWKGTGPIKGFAITFIFGLITNIYTSLFATKVFQEIVFKSHKDKMSI